MAEKSNRLGENLLRQGYITDEQLHIALNIQRETGDLIGTILVGQGFISSQDLTDFITTSQFSRLGERLIQSKLITPAQLKMAMAYQEQNGGRLGDILILLNHISKQKLEDFLATYARPKLPLGQMLVQNKEITEEQLGEAIAMQKKSGGRIGDVLLFLKHVTPETLYRYLATQNNLGRVGNNYNRQMAKKIPYEIALQYNAILINSRPDSYILAVGEILPEESIRVIGSYLDKPVEQVLATMIEIENLWEMVYGHRLSEDSVFKLYEEQPENSAIVTFSKGQRVALIAACIAFLIVLIANYRAALFVGNILVQGLYAIMTILKLYIVYKGSYKDAQLHFTPEEIAAIDETKLPVYTILVPVYKEKEVIKQLIHNIQALDYPQYKLDVCILLEEDDKETIETVMSMNLPHYFTPIIVPSSQPKTKPKACNYGLIRAKGRYVVIYDAEDRPEPDQLKKVYLAFKQLPSSYVCIQCKLNYFNSNQNLLTRFFTQEYSMWFEMLLVGIMQTKTPIPLGGTSNHFKIDFLREVGAWDPFNVTEDADLGIRLFKKGYHTAIVDSRTWEEANSDVSNWLRQRSRWIKGYMQTWLVHMRHPVQLYRICGFKGFIGYQAMVLGTPLLPLLNPIFWFLLVFWYLTHAGWISSLFPGILYYLACFQLIFGNFMFMYTNAVGMYWVIRDCSLKNKQPFSYGLIKYALLTPLYWMLMSVAAYKALIQLVLKPFYWEKTNHGLTAAKYDTVNRSNLSA
ncbi:glycosyltransferase family 2 protein [Desulforamulus aeronauticus]|uniref:Glycosyltransferase, catalytic subunit of cellulose synthase and poly-beta-1,6-N-acetylglucosamine synthase n=1 Tax=Desulforamulus aeronauticus DSM 10349 TaxID=1121421 RepID=A0A1M6NEK4_9FIRM|nr:glycosyltransferase family 2 protein [Desulforamulus aeronauticus]SHJ94044.1 Glycosyltransferase, catalytic subunit of cellulose synthase and poly-beta-1,6-N-acetylglucosamine synthase [Desulforamulus aeronauticus DSM 10349]